MPESVLCVVESKEEFVLGLENAFRLLKALLLKLEF